MSASLKFFILLTGLYFLSNYFNPKRNNICRTFADYNFPQGNENCYYDPNASLETPELIKKLAGIVETHEVITEDGYILTMFRIPRKNPRGVILLHHSIATYSHIYLFQGNDSLAMTLWRNGFDVWLANQRGTSYSDKHLNLTKYDYKFWDYSFHEMGLYDVTSELKLIREKTNGSRVTYFGHSLGGTIGLVYSAMKPQEAKTYLERMILLSPAVHLKNMTLTTTVLLRFFQTLMIFTSYFQIGCPLIFLPFLAYVAGTCTRLFPPFLLISTIFIWTFCGFTPSQTDPTFSNYDAIVYLNNYSWKTLFHYGKMINNFQMYDYGSEKNLKVYGSSTPPLYPVEDISVPTLMITSSNDGLVSQKDCEEIFQRFSPEAAVHGHWRYTGMNHIDFLVGRNRKELFLDRFLEFLKNK